jgi:hypothetical protein
MKRTLFIFFTVFLSASVALAAPCPLAPSSLTTSNITATTVDLYWQCSTCSPGNVPTFNVYRNGALLGTAAIVAYRDSAITQGTTYTYTVTSIMLGWDESSPTNIVTVTVPMATATPTATPAFPQASTVTPSPTATRTPAPTSTPFAIVADPSFMNYQTTDWVKSGTVAWQFGKMTLNSGASISQTVTWVTGTHCYNVTVRASSPTSATMNVAVSGITSSFNVTRTTSRTFGYVTSDVYMPAPIVVSNGGAGTLSISYIGLVDTSCGTTYAIEGVSASSSGPLPISDMLEYFTALDLTPRFSITFGVSDWDSLMRTAGGVAATLWQIGYQDIVEYYIGARVMMVAVMWVVGFVMKKLGAQVPTSEVVVVGQPTGIHVPSRLPRLPSSGIYGGRRR